MPDTATEQPASPPAQMPDRPLAHLDTGYLQRAKNELVHFIPSDPTFLAHVGQLLRALVIYELQNPDRLAADQAAADQLLADAKAAEDAQVQNEGAPQAATA